jgi:hypothetical protein
MEERREFSRGEEWKRGGRGEGVQQRRGMEERRVFSRGEEWKRGGRGERVQQETRDKREEGVQQRVYFTTFVHNSTHLPREEVLYVYIIFINGTNVETQEKNCRTSIYYTYVRTVLDLDIFIQAQVCNLTLYS